LYLTGLLLLRLHEESDFDDLVYLVRQVRNFCYLSWRGFFPATEPVTIEYPHEIASKLGNLKPVTSWNSAVLAGGRLRGVPWFL
jgi:hypothetical protein